MNPAEDDTQDAPPQGSAVTLLKVEGWPEGFTLEENAALEIAYDAESASALWEQTATPDLPDLRGDDADPASPGIHGSLDDVDFGTHVVARYLAGESGSCPESLTGITTDAQARVRVQTADPESPCTADYNAYQSLVAVPRDDVPSPDAIDDAFLDFDHPSLAPGPVTRADAD